MNLDARILEKLKQHDQLHLVQFWDELTEDEQWRLQQQIQKIDFALLEQLIAKRNVGAEGKNSADRASAAHSPEQLIRLPQNDADLRERKQAEELGTELLKAGQVGAILVAGGQGSRLGFDQPKGMFPIGPVSGQTLFQILCEQLRARSERAGVAIPFFIMTSEATHVETTEFFEQNDFFGLGKENVYFFQQASLPAIEDSSHRIFLAEKGLVATSPDGHGGVLSALERNGMFQEMRERGIEHLFYHQVDNPTAIVCDPVLIGLHEKYKSDLTTKVVAKVSPEEKMGVLVTIDGRTEIIEYSDLPGEAAVRRDDDGNYVFWAGNTAIHVFRRAFMESLLTAEFSLPFHVAHKKIPHVDHNGRHVEPETPNGNKFEQFIFDALQHARVALVVEGDRQREFNPVKNAEGSDSPATARGALERIAAEWVRAAGGHVAAGVKVEISPLLALDEGDLKNLLPEGQEFIRDCVLKR